MNKKLVVSITITILCTLIVGSSFAYAGERSKSWKVKSINNIQDNPKLLHVSWEKQRPPYEELDKITLHWVTRKDKLLTNDNKVIFMLPGTWQAGGFSDIKDDSFNTMLYLANNGYDVYSIDYRTSNIQDMEYDKLIEEDIDISSTTDWDYGVFREDIKACVDKIKWISGADKVFMSGFSRGGTLMYIYASKYQDDIRGLISLDGGIKDLPASGEALDEDSYDTMIDIFEDGELINPQDGTKVPWVFGVDTRYYDSWRLAGLLPDTENLVGQALPKKFDDISDFVADDADSLWGSGVFTNYHEGNIDKDILIKSLNDFTRYYPSIQTLEDLQMAAYDDVPYFDYDDNEIDIPAIAFVTDLTCPGGPDIYKDFPNMTINEDVTINYLPDYGHMDVLFGEESLDDVKEPLLDWLDDHAENLRYSATDEESEDDDDGDDKNDDYEENEEVLEIIFEVFDKNGL